MNHRKRPLAIVSALLVLLTALLCWPVYRQYEQERKDQVLIAAIKAGNEGRVLESLDEGANANAHDTGEPPSFGQMLRRFVDHWLSKCRTHLLPTILPTSVLH